MLPPLLRHQHHILQANILSVGSLFLTSGHGINELDLELSDDLVVIIFIVVGFFYIILAEEFLIQRIILLLDLFGHWVHCLIVNADDFGAAPLAAIVFLGHRENHNALAEVSSLVVQLALSLVWYGQQALLDLSVHEDGHSGQDNVEKVLVL